MNKWTIALVILLAAGPVPAKKLYKYQDEKGQWHFSDKPPATTQPVDTEQIRISYRNTKVSLRNRGSQNQPIFYGVNEYHGPVELEVNLALQNNIATAPQLPARFIIPGTSETTLFKLWPIHPDRSWSYRLSYRFILGDPAAEHRPPPDLYRLPYEKGQSFFISQAFHGRYSHQHPQSEYAVDFAMPEGTKILAARSGIVMDVTHDFFTGGTDKEKHLNRANLIRILHNDGTMAVYGHLQLETAWVSPGMKVKKGQFIARSGNTGYTSGPHLHFVIQKNAGMELVSVPFRFNNGQGETITPQQGMILTAE